MEPLDDETDDAPLARPAASWKAATGLQSVLDDWRADGGIARCFALDEKVKPREGRFVALPEDLPPSVAAALLRLKIST